MVKSISYPIAKTIDMQWVHINDAKHEQNYFCPECDSPFIARLGNSNTHHFAHKPDYLGVCTGESGYHSLAKHLLAYHCEHEGQIPLLSVCKKCHRRIIETKKVIKIEVEKGQDNYRPDLRIFLEGDIEIDCEVVYKNPLGEKIELYRQKESNLLIWFITAQVNEVPPFVQYGWLETGEDDYFFLPKRGEERLLLVTSSLPTNHDCIPYGIAYIAKVDCYRCHHETKIVLLSTWYPMWGQREGSESYMSIGNYDICYHDNLSNNEVPYAFWNQINSKFGTKLSIDFSKTVQSKYLMNHCSHCGAKIGDAFLYEAIVEKAQANIGASTIEKVEILFTLTDWEKKKIENTKLQN